MRALARLPIQDGSLSPPQRNWWARSQVSFCLAAAVHSQLRSPENATSENLGKGVAEPHAATRVGSRSVPLAYQAPKYMPSLPVTARKRKLENWVLTTYTTQSMKFAFSRPTTCERAPQPNNSFIQQHSEAIRTAPFFGGKSHQSFRSAHHRDSRASQNRLDGHWRS
jgi:hypothetical protein